MTCEIALFDSARLRCLDGTVDLNTNTFKVALLNSGWTPYSAVPWVSSNDYLIGDIITSTTGRYYEVVTAGRSSGTEPTWSGVRGALNNDNTVVWKCWGLCPPSTNALFGDVSGYELAGGGYAQATLPSPTLTLSRRSVAWGANPVSFAAFTGAPKYAVIYRYGSENGVVNPLLAYILLDSTGGDVNVTLDNPFTLAWGTSSILSFA